MRNTSPLLFSVISIVIAIVNCTVSFAGDDEKPKQFKVHPIGYVRKTEDKTTIVLDKKYEAGLLRMEKQSEIWVLWWFDSSDPPNPEEVPQRLSLCVPLTGLMFVSSP